VFAGSEPGDDGAQRALPAPHAHLAGGFGAVRTGQADRGAVPVREATDEQHVRGLVELERVRRVGGSTETPGIHHVRPPLERERAGLSGIEPGRRHAALVRFGLARWRDGEPDVELRWPAGTHADGVAPGRKRALEEARGQPAPTRELAVAGLALGAAERDHGLAERVQRERMDLDVARLLELEAVDELARVVPAG